MSEALELTDRINFGISRIQMTAYEEIGERSKNEELRIYFSDPYAHPLKHTLRFVPQKVSGLWPILTSPRSKSICDIYELTGPGEAVHEVVCVEPSEETIGVAALKNYLERIRIIEGRLLDERISHYIEYGIHVEEPLY